MRYQNLQLGILGFGASKEDALAAFRDAETALNADFKAAANNFPKAAYSIQIWERVMPVEKDFYRDRDEAVGSSRGITDWGSRVDKANKYKDAFLDAKAAVIAKAKQTKEKAVDPDYDPEPSKKKDSGIPWLWIGVGAAALVAVGLLASVRSAPAQVQGFSRLYPKHRKMRHKSKRIRHL